jgi:NitT/TauT family transport system permease protein
MKKEAKTLLPDLFIFGLVGLSVFAIISTAQRWTASMSPAIEIHLEYKYLPFYALFSLSRAVLAYLLSLGFALSVGYWAAKSRFIARLVLPLITLGQSVPSMGLFAGLALGLITLFPKHNLGLELACILLLFISQTWNMTLSFYSSVKSIPSSIYELSEITGMSPFQIFHKIEIPAASTGLAWNSMISMAGAWFFLSAIESFTIGTTVFRVPGLRSYMSVAVERGDYGAQVAALLAMLGIILFVDFVVWRPVLAWIRRYRMDEDVGQEIPQPLALRFFRESRLIGFLKNVWRSIANRLIEFWSHFEHRKKEFEPREWGSSRLDRWKENLFFPFLLSLFLLLVFVLEKFYQILHPLQIHDYLLMGRAACATLLRVFIAVTAATLWTVPAAIGIGLSPKLTSRLQPIIQIAASFPVTMLFPIILGLSTRLGVGLSLTSSFLMLLSVQWYIVFNVLSGAVGISQDLRENFLLMRVPWFRRWKDLYLPSVFPSLVTGWTSAIRRAWNVSVVSEYFHYHDQILQTFGLGAVIRNAVSAGNFHLFTGSLIVLSGTTLAINRFFIRRLVHVAHTRYRFER